MNQSLYGDHFYRSQVDDSLRSARAAVPAIAELVRPISVLDVGCGAGTWLSVWHGLGVSDLMGIDGGVVPEEALRVPTEQFRTVDLEPAFSLGRRFDLVMSLEVAEHLPEPAASRFVRSLCEHGDVVVFSAAIPGQYGLGHVNCQWQSYWQALFAENGLQYDGALRARVWGVPEIGAYYRQNMMLFRRGLPTTSDHDLIDVVHPAVYASRVLVPKRRVVEMWLRSYNVRSRFRAALHQRRRRKP